MASDFQRVLQRAQQLHREGKLAEAAPHYAAVLESASDHFEALRGYGILRLQQGRWREASELMQAAATARPRTAPVHYNLGLALNGLGRYADAVASYDRALALQPGYYQALNNRANSLLSLRRPREALESADRALAVKPDHAAALNNRGNALRELNRPEEAIESYRRALAFRPDLVEAMDNLGAALQDLNRLDEAIAAHVRAQALRPDFASAHFNEAIARLRQGDLANGWAKFEWRWKNQQSGLTARAFTQPLWLGGELPQNQTVLLHAEQGLGDTIHFVRYAPLVVARGASVILEVPVGLKPLLDRFGGASAVVARGEPLPVFDLHCPLLSLPLAFRTELATVPARIPYIAAPAERVGMWRERIGLAGGPAVGVAWAGGRAYRNDHNRSMSLAPLRPLFEAPGCRFFSLQRDVPPGDAAVLAAMGEVSHLGPDLRNFADTAAVVSMLDLVISVDTSVAHLAGAMGKPVWILLPFAADWRWMLDREDSPWYPTARLFRQKRIGDWDSVVARVRNELAGIIFPPA